MKTPLPLLPPPPPPPDFSLSPPTPTQQLFHPFPPPTHHRKKRSKNPRIATTITKKPDPCTECGKTFLSWKALFGHMRCHPERQWRGINPPPHLRHRSSPPSPPPTPPPTSDDREVAAGDGGGGPRFECSSCKKTFGSYQALGGHRASHKNVKGCFAITNTAPDDHVMARIIEGQNRNFWDHSDDMEMGLGLGHKCAICLRVFSTGQALVGQMKCHWDQHQPSSLLSFGPDISPFSRPMGAQCSLDLNLPAPLLENGSCSFYSNNNNNTSMQLDLRLGI